MGYLAVMLISAIVGFLSWKAVIGFFATGMLLSFCLLAIYEVSVFQYNTRILEIDKLKLELQHARLQGAKEGKNGG